ncbi:MULTISPECIES: ABC transporter permease [unclassified Kribbella]|uniref:ABC transporter permease n=1 Tax=unclassified Kribbella TaxID=2644121 RepID=UPI003015DB0B
MSARAGVGVLVRFVLRQERRGLPWWLLGAGLLLGYQSAGSQSLYDTPEALADLRQTMTGNAAIIAMSGPERLLDTIGGEVVFEIFSYLAVLIGLMNMFLVGRHTRTDEETGRGELIRSTRTGRHAPLTAALCVAGLADLAVALVIFAAAAGTGLPVGGSVLLGAASAGVGIAFAALTAVAVQVFENPRSMYGAVGAAIGAAFVLRAAGDIGNPVWSWLSPIGWGQRTFPYAGDRWWPLLVPLAATAVLVALALALEERRDFGDGLLPYRKGRPTASWALGSPLGLAWRLQRGSLIGWTIGLLVLGAAYGSFTNSIEDFVADNPEIAEFLPGGAADVVDSYLAVVILISALLAAASGVSNAMRARHEETSGRAEPVLATPTSRWSWLAGHVTVTLAGSAVALAAAGFGHGLSYGITISDPGQIPRLTAVALVHLPAVWLVVAVAVLGIGWLPRAAATAAWIVVGYCAVIAMFADSFKLPDWSRQASPFIHTPEAPLETVTAIPLLIVGALAAAFLAAGFAGLHRRDFGY